MAQPAKAQEPTMEEILASIRRIIADDDASKGRPDESPAPAAKPAVAASQPQSAADEAEAMSQEAIDAMLAGADSREEPPEVDEAPDVFDLTEDMAAPAPEPPGFRKIDPSADVVISEKRPSAKPEMKPAPTPAPIASMRPRAEPCEDEPAPLISAQTSAAVDAAFNSLAHTVLVQNAKTLEDLVKEMLRPMLKAWLDDNLPTLVERLVRAEIERVSRGRG